MKKYVFSYFSYFDNNLTSEIIESDLSLSPLEVAKEKMIEQGWQRLESITTLEELKDAAFDGDSMFEIIEI